MDSTGDNFVVYVGIFITVVVLLFVVIAPIWIMPLFNKFDPIEENILKRDIDALAKDVSYPVTNIEVVDGSKRSGHSNAFQTGIGKTKKIVLFDTLMEQHLGILPQEEKEGDEDEKVEEPVAKEDEHSDMTEGEDENKTEKKRTEPLK